MKIIKLIALILILSFAIFAQQDENDRKNNMPVEPFRIVGNVYYVGASDITSFLITTPQGHFLLDGGYAETAPQIKANIVKLDFKLEDVKFLLNSQGHYDHAAGLAELKRATGAQMLASAGDKPLLENGGKGDFRYGDRLSYEPVTVDRIIKDNEKLKLGGVTLTARLTPGHTKGCTTWLIDAQEDGKNYSVIFVGSTSSLDYQMKNNAKYPNIASDYEKTFRLLKSLNPDIFLGAHGSMFGLLEKAEAIRKSRTPNPFIDRESYRKYIEETEKSFREKLAKK